jgi:hypothetical protein
MSDPKSCPVCGSSESGLDEHHWQYEPECTVKICRQCHTRVHQGQWSQYGKQIIGWQAQEKLAEAWRKEYRVEFKSWHDIALANLVFAYLQLEATNGEQLEPPGQELSVLATDLGQRVHLPSELENRFEAIVRFVDKYVRQRNKGVEHIQATIKASSELLNES